MYVCMCVVQHALTYSYTIYEIFDTYWYLLVLIDSF